MIKCDWLQDANASFNFTGLLLNLYHCNLEVMTEPILGLYKWDSSAAANSSVTHFVWRCYESAMQGAARFTPFSLAFATHEIEKVKWWNLWFSAPLRSLGLQYINLCIVTSSSRTIGDLIEYCNQEVMVTVSAQEKVCSWERADYFRAWHNWGCYHNPKCTDMQYTSVPNRNEINSIAN